MAKVSYKPEYGARPVRRKVQDLIEDPIAERILDGSFKPGSEVIIDKIAGKDELSFKENGPKTKVKVKIAKPKKAKLVK